MSEEDKSGSEGNLSKYEPHEIPSFDGTLDQRTARPVEEVMQVIATRAMQMEDQTQRVPIVVFPQYVCINCIIFLPCGYHATMAAYINWQSLTYMTDAEVAQTLNRLLQLATEDANRHTDKHKGRTEFEHE